MSFTRKLGIGFAGMAAVTATVWTYQQQDSVVEKQTQNIMKKMDRQQLQDFESKNAIDLKKTPDGALRLRFYARKEVLEMGKLR